MRGPAALVALALALAGAGWGAAEGAGGACGVAEWACRGGGCVRLDAYCDGERQCADGSDEPADCTVCNRTYYGRAGLAYSLAVRHAPRVPFLCHLTFTAGGGAHGDLVQLAFEEFRVGRYEAGALDGCPDGYMQVSELGRPFTGGSWCGAAEGAALYYSETSTVTVSVKVFRARLGEPFGLRLRYKFLSQREAVVRFGPGAAPLERGAVSPGTYCTRTYEECHRRPCRLQSPNYPGMYPRNVTCYWSVRQKAIPTCKHAMVSVRQEHAHKMQMKRSVGVGVASVNKTRGVWAWAACTGDRDRLIVYDGPSTDDAVLLEYCGGDWLPRVTARGPDMLVAFHSSPYSAPPTPARPDMPLRGFELDVDVIFADSDSLDYAREARRCEFHVKASSSEEEGNSTAAGGSGGGGGAARGRRGVLHAPAHTLPPDTTCTWTFHGRPGDVVWIYFSSYTQYSLVAARRGEGGEREEVPPAASSTPPPAPGCAVELRIWEAAEGAGGGVRHLGRYCDAPPALCARAALANATRAPRPCAPPDGYVSAGALLSLSATSRGGTATHPLSFALHYEFVDARVEGAALGGRGAVPAECARLLTAPGEFSSPRNALWFGRGGARRLRCIYRLEGAGRVEVSVEAAAFGRSPRCSTRPDPRTGRLVCVPHAQPAPPAPATPAPDPLSPELDSEQDEAPLRVPHLWIYESPWPGHRVPVACVCDNSSVPVRAGAAGGGLELELVAAELAPRDDHRHIHFRGRWTRRPGPECARARRLRPPGQHLHLTYPYESDRVSECGETPFLVWARGNRSVFLRVWGEELPPAPPAPPAASTPGPAPEPLPCHTANRVLVYHAHSARLLKAICPSGDTAAPAVHTFTEEWEGGAGAGGRGAALLVVWSAREAGAAHLAWMEVWRAPPPPDPAAPPAAAAGAHNATAHCAHACLALAACMDGALWCDGAADCPGGGDEAGGARCGAGARLLAALSAPGAAGAAGAGLALVLAGVAVGGAVRRARARRSDKRVLGALAAGRRLTEELLFDASRASTAS